MMDSVLSSLPGVYQTDRSIVRRALEVKVQLVYIIPESIIEISKCWSMLLSAVYKEK